MANGRGLTLTMNSCCNTPPPPPDDEAAAAARLRAARLRKAKAVPPFAPRPLDGIPSRERTVLLRADASPNAKFMYESKQVLQYRYTTRVWA
jgi:hypothetical protein